MRKTNTNLSNYDDFRKYSVEEIGNMFGIGKTKTRELLQSRLLPVTKIGRDYFTSKTAIQDKDALSKNFSCNIMQLHLLFIWYFKESSFHSKGANLNVE